MKRLGIIVPYRNRQDHLCRFIPHMENFFRTRSLLFKILVIEQSEGKSFNRAKLLNAGYTLARDRFDYFCFHDVDMLPEDDSADYSWADQPTHLAARASQFGYRLPYAGYFGGVTLIRRDDFEKINGFSNGYWGWGMEDDDLLWRCGLSGIITSRRPGKFLSLPHDPGLDGSGRGEGSEEIAENRRRLMRLMKGEIDFTKDGLSDLDFRVLRGATIFQRHELILVEI